MPHRYDAPRQNFALDGDVAPSLADSLLPSLKKKRPQYDNHSGAAFMKVFISWSGEQSRSVALALKDWLPDVLQDVEAWMSEHDLDAGVRWTHRLAAELEEATLGVICLTPDNQAASWLLFEAGALSKSVQESRLIPYLIGMSPADVRSPLSQFQAVLADEAGTRRLLESVNAVSPNPLTLERLNRLFVKWWPDLELRISSAKSQGVSGADTSAVRPDREILGEILELMRSMAHSTIGGYNANAPTTLNLTFDTQGLGRKGSFRMRFEESVTVSDFLDAIYFRLRKRDATINPFTYVESWVLKNSRNGVLYNYVGVEYCRSHGQIRDNAPIATLNLRDGDVLQILRP